MEKPTCEFCSKTSTGVYSHQYAPVSLAVCEDHYYKLSERFWIKPPKPKKPVKWVISKEERQRAFEAETKQHTRTDPCNTDK